MGTGIEDQQSGKHYNWPSCIGEDSHYTKSLPQLSTVVTIRLNEVAYSGNFYVSFDLVRV